ncbi:MAG: prolyl oligopeptidase family serine peptidase [Planctomycetota bacterium]
MRFLLPLVLLASVAAAEVTVPAEWLVLSPTDRRGRRPFNADAVFRTYVLTPGRTPKVGETVEGSRGKRAWRWLKVDEKGVLRGRFAWAYTIVKSDRDQVALVAARGSALLVVNGALHVGDVYRYGVDGVPVRLRKGINHVFVRGARGGAKLDITELAPGAHLSTRDATMPDLVVGRALDAEASVVVANTGARTLHGVPSMGVRRLPVRVRHPAVDAKGRRTIELEPSLGLRGTFRIDAREPKAARWVTFLSAMDGSVQRYGLREPTGDAGPGVVLTLHGAGVQGRGQANCYANRDGLWIVAPTNRRPFGFDWQDWGRTDAYEVLAHAQRTFASVDGRVHLTGHSMGGHGAWHLGANDPDRWSGVAPCAAWESFDTYGRGARDGAWEKIWRGADLAGETRTLIPNLAQQDVFILHGEDDRTVPVTEARRMEELIRKAGGNPRMHLEPGKGHWYNGSASKGVDCVDWPGIFSMFAESGARGDPDSIEFLSADPGIDADHFWLTYLQPANYGELGWMKGDRRSGGARIETRNVRRFRTDVFGQLDIDGTKLVTESPAEFVRSPSGWSVATPAPAQKRPDRCGPFKRAFDRRFVLVYGDSDRFGRARALLDAQRWWYYGNGDCAVLSDREFAQGDYRGRNVILYGNAESNRAWSAVVPDACPIQLRQGEAKLGARVMQGDDLGCFFVYPRRGETDALVGVVGWTGLAGGRATTAVSYFSAGVGLPDYTLFGADVLAKGDAGVRAAGWFDHAWQVIATPAR